MRTVFGVLLVCTLFSGCFMYRFFDTTTVTPYYSYTRAQMSNYSREPKCLMHFESGYDWCISTEELSHFEAMYFCHQENMKLLSMESSSKWGDMLGRIARYGSVEQETYTYHTSGMSLPKKGWSWIDIGKPASIGIYEQDDFDCLGFTYNVMEISNTYKILNCRDKHYFICERTSDQYHTTPRTSDQYHTTPRYWTRTFRPSTPSPTTHRSSFFENITSDEHEGTIDILLKLFVKPKVSVKSNINSISYNTSDTW